MKLRRILVVLFTLCLAVGVLALSASAETVASGTCGAKGDNIKWVLDDAGTLTISGKGEMDKDHEDYYYWKQAGIKKVVVSEGVTSIGISAFGHCTTLESVSLPESLKNIYHYAFIGCNNLKSIRLPGQLKHIYDSAFQNCDGLESVVIPESVYSLSESAFGYCDNLSSVTLNEGLLMIGDSAFAYCPKLTGIQIPETVTGIMGYAFDRCTALTEITIPKSVTMLGDDAFSGCTALEKVIFRGNAPRYQEMGYAFRYLTAKAYYPKDNATWTDEIRHIHGAALDWIEYSPLEILSQSKTTYTKQGAQARATVTASGEGLTYQWYIKNAGAAKYGKSSVTSANYSCTMNSTSKDRLVYCVITDALGSSVKTETVRLRMAATITEQPTNAAAAVGSVAKTTVTAVGDGLTYTWYINNPGASAFSKSSVTSATYSCRMTEAINGRQVYCVVTDKYGKTAKSNTVKISLPTTLKILSQSKTTYTKQGMSAKATVTAVGDGLTYQWYIKNTGATKYSKSSIQTNTYSVAMSSSSKDRLVYCVVTDKYGKTARSETVRLRMAATITSQPKNVIAANGAVATTTVKAVGDGLTYTWYIKNPGKTAFSKSSVTTASYTCRMSAANDGREVYCVVTDKYGKTAKSTTAVLSME